MHLLIIFQSNLVKPMSLELFVFTNMIQNVFMGGEVLLTPPVKSESRDSSVTEIVTLQFHWNQQHISWTIWYLEPPLYLIC